MILEREREEGQWRERERERQREKERNIDVRGNIDQLLSVCTPTGD